MTTQDGTRQNGEPHTTDDGVHLPGAAWLVTTHT